MKTFPNELGHQGQQVDGYYSELSGQAKAHRCRQPILGESGHPLVPFANVRHSMMMGSSDGLWWWSARPRVDARSLLGWKPSCGFLGTCNFMKQCNMNEWIDICERECDSSGRCVCRMWMCKCVCTYIFTYHHHHVHVCDVCVCVIMINCFVIAHWHLIW